MNRESIYITNPSRLLESRYREALFNARKTFYDQLETRGLFEQRISNDRISNERESRALRRSKLDKDRLRYDIRQLLRFAALARWNQKPLETFRMRYHYSPTTCKPDANPRSTYRGSEVVTDLVSKGDVRNRRWYVFAVVEEGDYTCVQRFHATSVVLQDEIALVPGLIVWVSWMRTPKPCYIPDGAPSN